MSAYEAALQVVDAWMKQGRAPWKHALAKRRLRREWPVLARALDRLTAEMERPDRPG